MTRAQIEANLRDVDLVEGTTQLFEFIVENGGEIIIISRSFTANVECGLEGAGLLRHVQRYFLNNDINITFWKFFSVFIHL